MNPLDPECPTPSPNYYDVCPLLDKFLDYTQKNGIVVDYAVEEEDEDDSFGFFNLFGMFCKIFGRKRRFIIFVKP